MQWGRVEDNNKNMRGRERQPVHWFCQHSQTTISKWNTYPCTWDKATGRLFDVNRPPERLPVGCWTPPEGTLFNVEFLDVNVPCMLGTLKLPWMLLNPWIVPAERNFQFH